MSHAGEHGGPAGQHGRRDDLGARPAEVRRRGRAPAVPGPAGRPFRRAGRRAEPVRPARCRLRSTTAWPTCAGCWTPRTCTTCRSWSRRRSPAPAWTSCASCWSTVWPPGAPRRPDLGGRWTASSPGSSPMPVTGRTPAGGGVRLASKARARGPVRGRRRGLGDQRRPAAARRELRAVDFVGWPVAWFVQRLTGRDPIRKVRLGMLWNDLRSVTAGPAGAQQAEIDNALTDLGERARRRAAQAVVADRQDGRPVASRRDSRGGRIGHRRGASGRGQRRLVVAAGRPVAGPAAGHRGGRGRLAGARDLCFGVFHADAGVPRLLSDTGALPWIGAGAVAALGLGAATASVCMRLVASTAERENTQVTADMRDRIAGVADEMVIMPAEQELSEFEPLPRGSHGSRQAMPGPAAGR